MLQVRRTFAPGSMLYCQFGVFGAAKEQKGSLLPQVTAGYEIRRADGTVFKRGAPSHINPTSVGALLRLHGISLQGAAPGDYDLVLNVSDDLGGRSVEVRMPFVIEAGAEPPSVRADREERALPGRGLALPHLRRDLVAARGEAPAGDGGDPGDAARGVGGG